METDSIIYFNNKYNLFYKNYKYPNHTILMDRIQLQIYDAKKCSKLYNDIFHYNLQHKFNHNELLSILKPNLLTNLQTTTVNIHEIKSILNKYNIVIENLEFYFSFLNFNKSFTNHIYDIMFDIFSTDNNIDVIFLKIIESIINKINNIEDELKFLKIFYDANYNLCERERERVNERESERERERVRESERYINENKTNKILFFINKLSNNIDISLNKLYDSNKINIIQVFDIINSISFFFRLSAYIRDYDINVIHQIILPNWSLPLIESITTADLNTLNKVISILNDIQIYIDSKHVIADLETNICKMIDNNMMIESNENLIAILSTSYKLLYKWKHESLKKTIVNKLNDTFNREKLFNYNLMIRSYLRNKQSNILFQNIIESYNMILLLKEFDYALSSYISVLQNDYINIDVNIEMIYNDITMYEQLNEVNFRLDNSSEHLSNIFTKYKYTINDIKKSNEYSKKIFTDHNIKLLITSNGNIWTETIDDIKNKDNNMIIHPIIEQKLDMLEKYHKTENSIYNLKVLNDKSIIKIQYKNYNLKMTLSQANVLLLFSNNDKISLNEICQRCCKYTNDKYVHNICESLVQSTILRKIENNIFEINKDFKLELESDNLDITVFLNNKLNLINQLDLIENISYDRENIIKCYIIKYVKMIPNLYHSLDSIYDNVSSRLNIFKFTKTDIETGIKSLVKSFYLEDKDGEYKYENA